MEEHVFVCMKFKITYAAHSTYAKRWSGVMEWSLGDSKLVD